MSRWAERLPPLLAPLGGVLVWLAERIWPGTLASPYLAALGAAALLAALAINLPHFREPGTSRAAAGWLAAPYALFVLALGCYYAGRALPVGATGGIAGAVDWADLALAGWSLALLAGVALFAFVTLARLAQSRTPQRDERRLVRAAAAGLSLALVLLLVVLLNVVFDHLPWEWDVAYFRATQASEATRDVAQGLSEPVQVGAFYEADSEVGPLMQSYLKRLADGAPNLQVRFVDADLQPELAEEYKVRGNGWVVLRKGEVLRPIRLGSSLDTARIQLRTFDRTFFSKLLEVSRPPAVVYLTLGHGERNERGEALAPGAGLSRLRSVLRERNYTVKDLGVAEGLGERVPEDAALVIAAAPAVPLLPGEAESLRRYLDGGGSLLALLEPRPRGPQGAREPRSLPGTPLEELLRGYGVEFDPLVQANDRIYAHRTYTKADHALLVTVNYGNHPSVATLHRAAGQFPLLLLGAGALHAGKVPPNLAVETTLTGMPGTWGDVDGDFEFSAGRERRGEPVLGLAVAPKGAAPRRGKAAPATPPAQDGSGPRLLVFADADLASDLLLQNRANLQLVEDALGWLVQRDAPVGLPESEEDVRIRHAKDDDWLWFYLPVLGVPALVLALGLYRTGLFRRRREGRDE
jgi:gliding motility-associatede transport system auxiliary component